MDNLNAFCRNILTVYPVNIFPNLVSHTDDSKHGVGSVMVALGILYLFMSVLIVYFIKVRLQFCNGIGSIMKFM